MTFFMDHPYRVVADLRGPEMKAGQPAGSVLFLVQLDVRSEVHLQRVYLADVQPVKQPCFKTIALPSGLAY